MLERTNIKLLFAYLAFAVFGLARVGLSQSIEASTAVKDSAEQHNTFKDSSLKMWHYGAQFIAGEVAFNATFFALGGNSLLGTQHQAGLGAGSIGILSSWVATPLAIHFLTEALHIKTGSWGFGILGAVLGTFAGITIFDSGTPSSIKRYLVFSLGIVTFSELFYDFAIWVSPN